MEAISAMDKVTISMPMATTRYIHTAPAMPPFIMLTWTALGRETSKYKDVDSIGRRLT